MARVIITEPTAKEKLPRWKISGEEKVTIALDQNEVVAVRNALRKNRDNIESNANLDPTSLHASGARVFEALDPVVRFNGWS